MTVELMARNPDGPLFRNCEGKKIEFGSFGRWFGKLRILANKSLPHDKQLEEKHVLYAMRRSFILNQYNNTLNMSIVSEMVGCSIPVMEKHYLYLNRSPAEWQEVILKLLAK
jgi:hypothetical protein